MIRDSGVGRTELQEGSASSPDEDVKSVSVPFETPEEFQSPDVEITVGGSFLLTIKSL